MPTRTFVLDTSVYVADPEAATRFAEHDVVCPIRVIEELEGLRHRAGDVGFAAREALRAIDRLRATHGTITDPVPVNDDGGTFRVEMNNVDPAALPDALRRHADNDTRILAVAANLQAQGNDVVVVTKDAPMRIRASVAGLAADTYRNEQVADSGVTGLFEGFIPTDLADRLFDVGTVPLADCPGDIAALAVNTCLSLDTGTSGILARVHADKTLRPIHERTLGKLRGKNFAQRAAIELLADPTVKIVTLAGAAGTGKSLLSIQAGLEAPADRQGVPPTVRVFRQPGDYVGGKDASVGFLPGDLDSKLDFARQPILDALEAVMTRTAAEQLLESRRVVVEPTSMVRGRTLNNSWVIVDEAQNLSRIALEAMLTRTGADTKVIVCFDPHQVDSAYNSPDTSVLALRERLHGHPSGLYGHVTLPDPVRSDVAKLIHETLQRH